jgi:hypothetical protein
MTFLELREYSLSLLDDLQGTYFTPVQMNRWLNNALKEVQKLLILAGQNYYIKCVTTPLVTYQRDYVLPQDFEHLHRLEIITGGTVPNETSFALQPITLNQQDMVPQQTGTPIYYYIKQNRLVLLPAPSVNYTIRLYYSYQAADMILDTDTPDVPEYFHEFIGILAVIDGMLKDGRDITPIVSKREYYEKMLKDSSQERQFDVPRGIVETQNNYFSDTYW